MLIEVTCPGDDNDLTVVSLKGYIDATTVDIIEQKLNEQREEKPKPRNSGQR